MRKRGRICILFEKVPEGTRYKKGQYSWVSTADGEQYIEAGQAVEHDPYQNAKKNDAWAESPEPEEEKQPDVHIHIEDKKPKPKLSKKAKKIDS